MAEADSKAKRLKSAYLGSSARRRHLHPFPARMAPRLASSKLRELPAGAVLLDPMCGSGSVLRAGLDHGLDVLGLDTDPLAVLISRVSVTAIPKGQLERAGQRVLADAIERHRRYRSKQPWRTLLASDAAEYVEYWFDAVNRKQLTALSTSIRLVHHRKIRDALWVAFSNMIVVKKNGVSRAMDVAHSRPHRVYRSAPVRAFEVFLPSVSATARLVPTTRPANNISVRLGDARAPPLKPGSVDAILTSPPYFNAIDYMRGHRLSLVWMGHELDHLRKIRLTNIGTEKSDSSRAPVRSQFIQEVARAAIAGERSNRLTHMVEKFAEDLLQVCSSAHRVLKPNGRAIFVTADSVIEGAKISNQLLLAKCAAEAGLTLVGKTYRNIPAHHRYLPPPEALSNKLQHRMRRETVSTFAKPSMPV